MINLIWSQILFQCNTTAMHECLNKQDYSFAAKHSPNENEWYPRGLQISLHIRSPGFQDYSEVWNLNLFRIGGRGGILKLSDLDSLTIFIWGGILYPDLDSLTIFIWGVFWNSRIRTLWQFSFWGRILYSDLDSLTIFILGGEYSVFQNRGILPEFGPKFQPLQQAHASQIVSHTLRIMETNEHQSLVTNPCGHLLDFC